MLQLEGTVIGGDFRVLRPLASGGMGGVYIAEQLSTGQQRALKIMHPTLVADPRMRDRFVLEARLGSQVPSQHVVQVISAGVDHEHGVPWLAMELLEGEDLASLAARRGSLPPAELVPIFRQLCHALGAAHASGVVHRDVKPENVFLATVHSSDTQWQVKVLDFGIAKLVADAKESATGTLGTPLWMAPEQSDPKLPVTPAADVWALGLMAFRLLTGRHYWHAANEAGIALSALFRETVMAPIVPASERAAEYGASAALPHGFDAWFARTVVRDAGQRFQDANQAFAAFEALATSAPMAFAATAGALPGPVTAPSGSGQLGSVAGFQPAPTYSGSHSLTPTSTRKSRAPIALVLGAGVLLLGALLVASVGGGFYYFMSEQEPSATAAPATTATSEPSLAASNAEPTQQAAADPAAATAETPRRSAALGAKPATPATTTATGTTADPTAPTQPAEPAPSAEPAGNTQAGLAPIDKAGTQAKVSALAANAAVSCASLKAKDVAAESYSGSIGFRPDGTASGSFQGTGGARDCVKEKVLSLRIGKYAHPQEWHVEVFPFAVTVK